MGWAEPGKDPWSERLRHYNRAETLANAIADAAGVPTEEAEAIAMETLLGWPTRISEEAVALTRTSIRWLWIIGGLVTLFLAGFFALLGLVLAKLVF
jgi:hypothetical protein